MYRVILAAVLLCLSYSSFAAKPPKPVDELEARVATLEAALEAIQANQLVWVDQHMVQVGIYDSSLSGSPIFATTVGIIFNSGDQLWVVGFDANDQTLIAVAQLFFTLPDCNGDAFITIPEVARIQRVGAWQRKAYVAESGAIPADANYQSRAANSGCSNYSPARTASDVVPAVEVLDLDIFALPIEVSPPNSF